jgi:hypothetical protein
MLLFFFSPTYAFYTFILSLLFKISLVERPKNIKKTKMKRKIRNANFAITPPSLEVG